MRLHHISALQADQQMLVRARRWTYANAALASRVELAIDHAWAELFLEGVGGG